MDVASSQGEWCGQRHVDDESQVVIIEGGPSRPIYIFSCRTMMIIRHVMYTEKCKESMSGKFVVIASKVNEISRVYFGGGCNSANISLKRQIVNLHVPDNKT